MPRERSSTCQEPNHTSTKQTTSASWVMSHSPQAPFSLMPLGASAFIIIYDIIICHRRKIWTKKVTLVLKGNRGVVTAVDEKMCSFYQLCKIVTEEVERLVRFGCLGSREAEGQWTSHMPCRPHREPLWLFFSYKRNDWFYCMCPKFHPEILRTESDLQEVASYEKCSYFI